MSGAAAEESSIEMLFTEIGPFLIAVEAHRVRTIRDAGAASDGTGEPGAVDLAQKLDRPAVFPGAWPRRVLEIGTARGVVTLVAGEDVWPGRVASARIQDVPGLVALSFRDAAIGRLFAFEHERFGFVLDPEALL